MSLILFLSIPNKVLKSDFTQAFWFEQSTSYSVQRIIPHPDFEPHLFMSSADIAILELNQCFDMEDPRIEALPICGRHTQEGNQGFLVGMGLTSVNPMTPAQTLMGVILDRYSTRDQLYHPTVVGYM